MNDPLRPVAQRRHRAGSWLVSLQLLLWCVVALPGPVAHAQDRKEVPADIFKALKPGQKVRVEERGGWLEIQLLDNGSVGAQTVVELGSGHIVVEDLVGITRRWIPVTAIRAVVWTRLPSR